jgi:hypothetical protein
MPNGVFEGTKAELAAFLHGFLVAAAKLATLIPIVVTIDERSIAGFAFDTVLFRVGGAKRVPHCGLECVVSEPARLLERFLDRLDFR